MVKTGLSHWVVSQVLTSPCSHDTGFRLSFAPYGPSWSLCLQGDGHCVLLLTMSSSHPCPRGQGVSAGVIQTSLCCGCLAATASASSGADEHPISRLQGPGGCVRELGWLFPGEVSPEWADRDLQLDTYSGLIWQVDMMLLLVGGFAHSTSHPLYAFSWQLRRLSSNYFVFSIASS